MKRIAAGLTDMFLDSNILLYLVKDDRFKTPRAEALMALSPVVSVQVLNEFIAVARRKHKLSLDEAVEALDAIKTKLSRIVPLTLDTHLRAIELSGQAKIGIYDANIVAAAELAGCDVLYTEDLNHGQRIGSVTIVNPFV